MNNRNVKPLSPFVLFCQKVIPLAFDESMSYYECLSALVNYLYNEVTPAVNNNADAVTELQEYVANYFDNLDVQEEINNKLDEMAESGQLADIIAQYLQLNGVLAFNTVSDLKNAENIIDGSFTRTFGLNVYNDGKGSYYKIRTLTSGDVIDEINILSLTNFDTLIAEKIPDYFINEINNNINEINNEINSLQEEIQNKTDYFNLTLQPNIIYDLANNDHAQGSCVIDNILYVYVESNFPYGDLYKFDIVNGTLAGKIENKKLYHGNDMCAIGNLICVASCKNDLGELLNKTICVYDTVNDTINEITPFTTVNKNYIFGIATYDENTLLCGLTNTESLNDLAFYLYDVNTTEISEITITNTNNLPTNIYYAYQSMEYLDNKIYLMTSLNDGLIEFIVNENVANINTVYNLPLIDNNGQVIGEYEGISKCSVFGNNALMITTIVTDNTYNNIKTIKAYVINPINNVIDNYLIYPNIAYYNNNEQRNIQYLKKTSTSLFEDGTANYPYKSLSRVLNSLNTDTSILNNDVIVLDSEFYYIGLLNKRNVQFGINPDAVTNPNIAIKRILNSNVTFEGNSKASPMHVYLTDNTDGVRYDVINSTVNFHACNIHLKNRTWIKGSVMEGFNSSITKMDGFSNTHLWLEAFNTRFYDSIDYGTLSGYWHRLAGDSVLYALGETISTNYATKVDRTANSTIILPGVK